MTVVKCDISECIHNNDGKCTRGVLTLNGSIISGFDTLRCENIE